MKSFRAEIQMVRLPRPAESFSENLLVSAHKASIHSKARQVVSNPASSGSHAAPVRLVSPHPVSYFKITKAGRRRRCARVRCRSSLRALSAVMATVTGHMVFFSAWLAGVTFVKKAREHI